MMNQQVRLPLPVSMKSRSSWRSCCYASVSVPPYPQPPNVNVKLLNGNALSNRQEIRLGLPCKGDIYDDTLELLKSCELPVERVNPRQYVAEIPQLSNFDVWSQRPADIVRKLLSGDLDVGVVSLDTVCEYGQGSEDLVIVHGALEYGNCRLSLAIPENGIFELKVSIHWRILQK